MAGPVTIDWGDGTPKQDGPEKGEVTHEYAEEVDGEQTITVCSKDDPSACTEVTFTPGEDGEEPAELKVTAAEDTADKTRMTVKATIDNTGQGPVKVDWGDGSSPQDGPESGDVSHGYPRAGSFTITAKDADDQERQGTAKVTVPFGPAAEPKAEAAPDEADESGRTAKLTYSGFPEGKVTIDWGDGSEAEEADGPKGETTHAYAAEATGEQTITVTSKTDDTAKATATFTPKDSEEPAEPKAEAAPDEADESGRTAKLTYSGFPEGKVTIDWGDGSEAEEADGPKGETTHAYAAEATGEQTITVTSKTDDTAKATATFTPKDSEEPAALKLTVKEDESDTTNRRSVIATVDNGGKPAAIDFGEGEQQDNPGDGQAETKYAYTKDGTYTVTAVDKDDQARKDTAEVTVPFGDSEEPAEPKAEAAPDEADESGRTAKLTYSGFPEGKVTIDWGDGSEPEKGLPTEGEATHAYAAEATGEQTITVTSEADDTKKATATFTPKDEEPAEPELAHETDQANPRLVRFTAKNLTGAKATFDYGDESEPEEKEVTDGQAKAEHTYPEKAEQAEYTAKVTADGKSAEDKVTVQTAEVRRAGRLGGARSVRKTK